MERNEEAGRLKLSGMSFAAIGRSLGVSDLIARRLVLRCMTNQERKMGWASGLDEKIKKAIYFGGITSKTKLQAKIDDGTIKLIPGLSDKFINQIVNWTSEGDV